MKKMVRVGILVGISAAAVACAGSDGTNGADGTPGGAGENGTAGMQGATGLQGASGSAGSTGSKGDPGTPYDAGPAVPASCKEIQAGTAGATDGMYRIQLAGLDLDVYCNMTGGGWTLIASFMPGNLPLLSYQIAPAQARGRYMPETAVKVLASASSQVRLVNHTIPTDYLESVANTAPILNLRELKLLNDDFNRAANDAHWTAAGSLSTAVLNYTCSIGTHSGYPDLYWACGNGTGAHLLPLDPQTKFNITGTSVILNVFLK